MFLTILKLHVIHLGMLHSSNGLILHLISTHNLVVDGKGQSLLHNIALEF